MSNPNSLVEGWARRYGRLEARPSNVNPLDEFSGLSWRLRGLRLKEWVGFTLMHPDWYSSLIIQDAHYLASSEIGFLVTIKRRIDRRKGRVVFFGISAYLLEIFQTMNLTKVLEIVETRADALARLKA